MGVDAMFYVRIERDFTDEERAVIRSEMRRVHLDFGPHIQWDPFSLSLDGRGYSAIRTSSRYFSVGCPRGHWPTLRGFGDFLANMFGADKVYYHSDSTPIGEYWEPAPWTLNRDEHEVTWVAAQQERREEVTIEIGVVSEADRQAALAALIEHAANPDEPGAWIADTAQDLVTEGGEQ